MVIVLGSFVESLEYNLWVKRRYTSSLKRLKNRLFSKGAYPGLPEERKEVTFLDWDEALALLEVRRELSLVA